MVFWVKHFSRVPSKLVPAIFWTLWRSIGAMFATNNPTVKMYDDSFLPMDVYLYSGRSLWHHTDSPIYSPFIVWRQKTRFLYCLERMIKHVIALTLILLSMARKWKKSPLTRVGEMGSRQGGRGIKNFLIFCFSLLFTGSEEPSIDNKCVAANCT